MKSKTLWLASLLLWSSCSPLRTSFHDERHQWELKLHEVAANLDDLKHDINCFQTEIQILDGRIKQYENSLANMKKQDLEKAEAKIEELLSWVQNLEKREALLEKLQKEEKNSLEKLSVHAKETGTSLTQFRSRIEELEENLSTQNRKFEELSKIKKSLEELAYSGEPHFKIYRVRPGDSLEKIARLYKTDVEKIRKLNGFAKGSDLIVVGQELKIPSE